MGTSKSDREQPVNSFPFVLCKVLVLAPHSGQHLVLLTRRFGVNSHGEKTDSWDFKNSEYSFGHCFWSIVAVGSRECWGEGDMQFSLYSTTRELLPYQYKVEIQCHENLFSRSLLFIAFWDGFIAHHCVLKSQTDSREEIGKQFVFIVHSLHESLKRAQTREEKQLQIHEIIWCSFQKEKFSFGFHDI